MSQCRKHTTAITMYVILELHFSLDWLLVCTTQEIYQRLSDVLWRLNFRFSERHVSEKTMCCVQVRSVFVYAVWLHFACAVDDAKCILVMRVCLSVCLSAAACRHYCTDPDITWGSGRGCPLVVHYWVDLQSVHGFRCCDSIQVCKLIALYTANAYSIEREMSASACTLFLAVSFYFQWQMTFIPSEVSWWMKRRWDEVQWTISVVCIGRGFG